jgi:hypothetical protein
LKYDVEAAEGRFGKQLRETFPPFGPVAFGCYWLRVRQVNRFLEQERGVRFEGTALRRLTGERSLKLGRYVDGYGHGASYLFEVKRQRTLSS